MDGFLRDPGRAEQITTKGKKKRNETKKKKRKRERQRQKNGRTKETRQKNETKTKKRTECRESVVTSYTSAAVFFVGGAAQVYPLVERR